MSKPTVTVEYDELEVNGRLVGTLEHCNCCGLREFSNFQDQSRFEDRLAEDVWDWFDDLSAETRVEYGLEVTKSPHGMNVYPPYDRMHAKFVEVFPEFVVSSTHLEALCYALSTIGKEWQPPTAITILALVENWDNAAPIMDALVEGGWQLSVNTVLNTNSSNDISLWTYRREEAV